MRFGIWLSLWLIVATFAGCSEQIKEVQTSPIEALQQGNARFVSGHLKHPHETMKRIHEIQKMQQPGVIVMSCSDSRVPPEIIFDQGLGDIFSVRTAGNVIGDFELGSIEYAVEHLGCHTIVVLGHKDCGAIKAYLDDPTAHKHLDHIHGIIEYIAQEEEEKRLSPNDPDLLAKAVKANMLHGVHLLRQSGPVLKEMITSGKLTVVGAVYDLQTGEVQFSNE